MVRGVVAVRRRELRVLNALAWVCLTTACQERVAPFPTSYVGVGVELTIKDGAASVVRVIEGGPAAEAGLKAGCVIMSVNGESTRGKGLADVVNTLRGPPDSKVTLEVVNAGAPPYRVVVVRRSLSKGQSDGGHYVSGRP